MLHFALDCKQRVAARCENEKGDAFITYLADWGWESLSLTPISRNRKCLFNPLPSQLTPESAARENSRLTCTQGNGGNVCKGLCHCKLLAVNYLPVVTECVCWLGRQLHLCRHTHTQILRQIHNMLTHTHQCTHSHASPPSPSWQQNKSKTLPSILHNSISAQTPPCAISEELPSSRLR